MCTCKNSDSVQSKCSGHLGVHSQNISHVHCIPESSLKLYTVREKCTGANGESVWFMHTAHELCTGVWATLYTLGAAYCVHAQCLSAVLCPLLLHTGGSNCVVCTRIVKVECTARAKCTPVVHFCAEKLLHHAICGYRNGLLVQKLRRCHSVVRKIVYWSNVWAQQCCIAAMYSARRDKRIHLATASVAIAFLCKTSGALAVGRTIVWFWMWMARSRVIPPLLVGNLRCEYTWAHQLSCSKWNIFTII